MVILGRHGILKSPRALGPQFKFKSCLLHSVFGPCAISLSLSLVLSLSLSLSLCLSLSLSLSLSLFVSLSLSLCLSVTLLIHDYLVLRLQACVAPS